MLLREIKQLPLTTMKTKDLIFEMPPYLHPGEMPRKILDGSISINAINREFSPFGKVDGINVLIQKDNASLIGLQAGAVPIDGRFRPVFHLMFKAKHELNFPNNFTNIVQETRVVIDRAFGNRGVMTSVYKMIVDAGFTLVSDSTQFESAQAMWIKLSRDPNYFIWVVDADSGFFKDEDGKIIRYVGQKLIDDQVWTTGSNYDGNYRLMILTKQDIR